MVQGIGLIRRLDDIRNVVSRPQRQLPVLLSDLATVEVGNPPRSASPGRRRMTTWCWPPC